MMNNFLMLYAIIICHPFSITVFCGLWIIHLIERRFKDGSYGN